MKLKVTYIFQVQYTILQISYIYLQNITKILETK